MANKQASDSEDKRCSRSGCQLRYYANGLCHRHYRIDYYWKQKGQKNPRPNRPKRRSGVTGEVWLPGAHVSERVKRQLEIEARALDMDLTPFIQRLLIAVSKDPATVRRLLPREIPPMSARSYK